MRKIEAQMLQAIANKQDWKCDNTEVVVTYFAHADRMIDRATVYLHGSPIAQVSPNTVTVCDCGYQTATTKSRINTILRELCGGGVYQRNHKWYGYSSTETEWLIEPNSSYCFVRG
jgi:hypothetical protein